MEHRISKQMIRKIPYFEKMLSHECLESKENKVVLDFDEQAFKIILDWVERDYTIILIEMDYAFDLYELADYLGLDGISKECITYFHKFTIEHLPIIIPKMAKTTKFMTSGALDAFICRHFLDIASSFSKVNRNTKKTFWSKFPIETIEYICALDLMINSEYQVFDAIMDWVLSDSYLRKCHLERLWKLVRWCHLNDKDSSNLVNHLRISAGFEAKLCSPRKADCDCVFNRAKQNCFVMIETLDIKDLRVKVLDNNFKLLVSQVIKEDTSIASNFFHDEHVSDILFDSGRRVIRIDWKQNKYNWAPPLESYAGLQRRIARSVEYGGELYEELELGEDIANGFLLLESTETFDLICFEGKHLHRFSMPIHEIYKRFTTLNNCEATLLNNKIYLLSNKAILYEAHYFL
ncbi:uncharacterized protein LOC107370994 [Tetranychus urticae]|uniref:uncharacterized protein LOC107370994 n=1 Tax=Tetranychus urticae TaxID=32264 RepID=UPI000D6596A7|nr:uncharacterized protein LOC107370994 [Tetranychus urticae]